MSAISDIKESLELAEAAAQDTVLVTTEALKRMVMEVEAIRAHGTPGFEEALEKLIEHWGEARDRQIANANRLLAEIDLLRKELRDERSGRATKRSTN